MLDRLLCFLVTGLAEQPSVCATRKTNVPGSLRSPGVKQLQHRPREAGEHRCFLTSSGPWFRTVRRLSFTEYAPINVNISPRVPTLALRIASLALGCALGVTWLSADTAPLEFLADARGQDMGSAGQRDGPSAPADQPTFVVTGAGITEPSSERVGIGRYESGRQTNSVRIEGRLVGGGIAYWPIL